MKTPTIIVIVSALCGACFMSGVCLITGVALRVLLPYYQGEQDRPKQLESREEVSAIMRGINRFVDQSPEHAFPSSLDEVKRFITIPGANLDAVLKRFVYVKPRPRSLKGNGFDGVILLEKLGHYKYRKGGYYGIAGDSIPGWYSLSNYQRFAQETGLRIEDFSEH